MVYPDGRTILEPECDVRPGVSHAQLTGRLLRQEAEKLLPHPHIGTAPPGGVTLVNIETVLWIDTAPDRGLGTVTLLGRRVDIRAHVRRVGWDFGDHSAATTAGPGQAYTPADPCRTAQCPNYFGHTYLRTGRVTIAAQLTWSGEFRVDGGAWQPIPGTVAAAATSTGIHVREARGVIVPNP